MGTQRLDFAEFYRDVKDECLFTVLVSVGDRDTAQDLVAEAFARAWASWRTVSRHPASAAWVVRTALNASISRWRRRRREVPVPDLALVADRPAADGGVGGSVDPRIMAALLRLPARQRQVVALRLFLDLDTAGTARVLGIAPGTVQAHLGRAMAALRDDLIPTRQENPVMNDNELIMVLREQRGKVPMDTPVEQIIRRGRAVRARRRVPSVAAALGAAAAAAFAVSAAIPASHPAREPHAQLAAWTVARQADGSY